MIFFHSDLFQFYILGTGCSLKAVQGTWHPPTAL